MQFAKFTKLECDCIAAALQTAAAYDKSRYGSMLSSFLSDLFSGKITSITDALAWITKYAQDHWGPKPVPVPATAAGDPLRAAIIEAVHAHQGMAKQAAGIDLPSIVDWIVQVIRTLSTSKQVQLMEVNFALNTIVPAMKSQGGYLAVFAAPLEVWLQAKKAELEAAGS